MGIHIEMCNLYIWVGTNREFRTGNSIGLGFNLKRDITY